MILYHGSNTIVDSVDLDRCRPYKDFGKGFYTTPFIDQAQRMARRVSRLFGNEAIVSVFCFDQSLLNNLEVLTFGSPDELWAQFVLNNRNRYFTDITSRDCNQDAKYDIVIGPVADDDIALLFRQYTENLLTLEMLARGMEFRHLSIQYSFHTKQSLQTLEFQGVANGNS